MIELQSVSFQYSAKAPIFQDFEWRAARGQAWSVIGPSGCGKSTLLYLLAGLRQPQQGQVLIHGEAITRPRPLTGLILQDYGLLPWATVRENASLGLRIRKFYGPDGTHAPSAEEVRDIQARTGNWLDRLGLEHVQDQYPGQISGGQRQRTAIARTLALNPDLLLMDEPFASLDAPTREDLQRLIWTLRREHELTTLIVTHAIDEAALLGEHILVLDKPPNTTPTVIANPNASQPDYAGSNQFIQVCQLLRQALESAQ
jgi:ABC-type nitrate/sulfonate/bicarbonate transport system ATPase subunit